MVGMRDVDGVMEGVQHNTMDVEYFGPNPQMQIWYLGALKAAEKMAIIWMINPLQKNAGNYIKTVPNGQTRISLMENITFKKSKRRRVKKK